MTSDVSDISDISDAPVSQPIKKPGPKPSAAKDGKEATSSDDRRMVTIHPGAEGDGMAPVKIGVNGNLYLVPRSVPCALPQEAINVLRDAVVTEWRDNGQGDLVRNDRQRFSFTIEG